MDRKFLLASIAIAVTALVVFHSITGYFVGSNPRTITNVTRVIDGDTLQISSGEKVRLLGINSPEVGQYYHDEARDALKLLVENHSIVLEKDVENIDKYGRLLRYIFVGDRFINLGMVRNGYAHAYIIQPNSRYSDDLEKAQEFARQNQLGIWKHSEYFGCIVLSGFNYSDSNEFVRFRNGCSTVSLNGWTVTDESSSHVYSFQNTSLGEITLHSAIGTDNSTDLFWDSKTPIWNNGGDTVFLRDAGGLLVLSYSYP